MTAVKEPSVTTLLPCPPALGSSCAWSPDMVKTESLLDLGAAMLAFWRWQWHPTPVLLPGESHGRGAW